MRKFFLFIFIVGFASCTLKEERKKATKTYFDLEGYFKKEAIRLAKKNEPIFKTVWINGKAEQKKISIKNWEQEFASFNEADINKASWKGEFKKSEKTYLSVSSPLLSTLEWDTVKTYTSKNDKIPVKKLEITTRKKMLSIKIFIENKNDLYTSIDSLFYYPDSLYLIKKTQHIKLMKEKKYEVSGKFN